ncbi:unnamed protein product [Parajaminaea phylloscopi]
MPAAQVLVSTGSPFDTTPSDSASPAEHDAMSNRAADSGSPTPGAQHHGAPQDSFFVRERERLVAEIAESLGQVLNNSNALNRKLEESILVGKEFEPVAALWGRFAGMMSSHGVGAQDPREAADAAAERPNGDQVYDGRLAESAQADALRTPRADRGTSAGDAGARSEGPRSSAMPIAPGGGTWTTSADPQS